MRLLAKYRSAAVGRRRLDHVAVDDPVGRSLGEVVGAERRLTPPALLKASPHTVSPPKARFANMCRCRSAYPLTGAVASAWRRRRSSVQLQSGSAMTRSAVQSRTVRMKTRGAEIVRPSRRESGPRRPQSGAVSEQVRGPPCAAASASGTSMHLSRALCAARLTGSVRTQAERIAATAQTARRRLRRRPR